MIDNPFEITLYDKAFTRIGWVNDPQAINATPRHMAVGSASITVPENHRRAAALTAKGTRAVIHYRGEFCMSGIITGRSGFGPVDGLTTVTLQDDLCLVHRMLGWPAPASAISSQGTAQDTRTGPAETVAKGFIDANKAHLVDPITVAADDGRGDTITVSSRMARLADQLLLQVDKAGVGLTVRQSGGALVVDAYEPTVYPHTLSVDSATILKYSWSDADPTMTSAIIGGPNENTAREFRRLVASALEAEYGYSLEGFVDARQADTAGAMDIEGQAALDAARATAGVKVELSESGDFRVGPGGVHVGDLVSVALAGQSITEVLREVELSFDRASGPVVTPTIGEHVDDPDLFLIRLVAELAAGVRDLRTR